MADPKRPAAKGLRKGNGIQLICLFDPETFAAVRARAVAAGSSVADQIRLLVEWGLEAETKS